MTITIKIRVHQNSCLIVIDPWKKCGYALPDECPNCGQTDYRPILKPDTRRRTFRNIDEDKIMVPLLKTVRLTKDNSGKIVEWEQREIDKIPPTIYIYHKRFDKDAKKWVQCYVGRIKVREEFPFKAIGTK